MKNGPSYRKVNNTYTYIYNHDDDDDDEMIKSKNQKWMVAILWFDFFEYTYLILKSF